MDFAQGQRLVVLILDDFDADPAAIRKLIPAKYVGMLRKGDPLSGGARLAPANRLIVSEAFAVDWHWPDALAKLFAAMGGEENLRALLDRFDPKGRIVELWVPVNGSPYQENNYFDSSTLKRLSELGLDLGFSFPNYELAGRD